MPERIIFVLLVAVLHACLEPQPPTATEKQALESCLEGAQLVNATQPAGFSGKNGAIGPMGRRITPVGKLVQVDYFPLNVQLSPDGLFAYVVHSGSWNMEVVDTKSGSVVQVLKGAGGFRGLAVGADGEAVYTGEAAHGTVTRFKWVHGSLEEDKVVELPGSPTELSLSRNGDALIVVSAANSLVWELDPATLDIKRQYATRGVYPYASATSPDDSVLLVTHVGDDTLTAISRSSGDVVGAVLMGLNPMGLAVDDTAGLAYVCNTDSDTISVVALSDLTVSRTIDVSHHEDQLPGGSPNEIVLSPDNSLAWISFADLNRVEVYRTDTWRRVGAIPTGHYPTGIDISADGLMLAVVASKGWGGAIKNKKEPCLLSLVDLPVSKGTLEKWTKQADSNVERTTQFWNSQCPETTPLPLDSNSDPVIDHVVIIVRENKTYDTVLGDFERGNGDDSLVVFGEEYTPNLHALAGQFTNLDNYYADSQESLQGHTWMTQGDCNDFFEKLYPSDLSQLSLFSYDPSTIIAERTIFDHLFDHSITFRNYGEFEGYSKDMFGLYKDYINQKFPYYNLAIKDVWKAEEFIRELNLGIFPQFVYIALPNDHTAGAKVGFPTPGSMVADNDEATGMVIDAISKSSFWENTAIFVVEDDPQGYGGDHVHAHRSICVVVSPWVKREFTSSVHYSIPAMYRTIEMIFRIPPMHKNDAFAPPMYDIFITGEGDSQPDYTPYDFVPRTFPEVFNEPDGRMSEESEKLDLSKPDAAPGMGYIIWRIMNGERQPPPYAKWNDR